MVAVSWSDNFFFFQITFGNISDFCIELFIFLIDLGFWLVIKNIFLSPKKNIS